MTPGPTTPRAQQQSPRRSAAPCAIRCVQGPIGQGAGLLRKPPPVGAQPPARYDAAKALSARRLASYASRAHSPCRSAAPCAIRCVQGPIGQGAGLPRKPPPVGAQPPARYDAAKALSARRLASYASQAHSPCRSAAPCAIRRIQAPIGQKAGLLHAKAPQRSLTR